MTESGDARKDVIGSFGPDERGWVFVVGIEVLADGAFQFKSAAMRSALDLAFAYEREPAFDQVEPGR